MRALVGMSSALILHCRDTAFVSVLVSCIPHFIFPRLDLRRRWWRRHRLLVGIRRIVVSPRERQRRRRLCVGIRVVALSPRVWWRKHPLLVGVGIIRIVVSIPRVWSRRRRLSAAIPCVVSPIAWSRGHCLFVGVMIRSVSPLALARRRRLSV